MNFYVSGLEIVTYLSQEDLVSLTNEMLQLSTLHHSFTNLSHLSTWAHINVTISVYRKFMKVWILWKYVGKNSNWFQLDAVLKIFILKANYIPIDLPKIWTGYFSLLLKYLSLYPIKPQINLYVWTALSAIANVIWWIMGRCKNGET